MNRSRECLTPRTRGVTHNSSTSKSNRRHPFIDEITETPLPKQWKALSVCYDITFDPDEYMSMYTNQISLYSTNDIFLFKVFSSTLRGLAIDWFTNLLQFSIYCFDTLTSSFTTHFQTSCRHDVTSLSLFNIRKKARRKSLRAFIDRFGMVSLKVKILNLEIILHYMINGLQVGPFANELCMKPPANMSWDNELPSSCEWKI